MINQINDIRNGQDQLELLNQTICCAAFTLTVQLWPSRTSNRWTDEQTRTLQQLLHTEAVGTIYDDCEPDVQQKSIDELMITFYGELGLMHDEGDWTINDLIACSKWIATQITRRSIQVEGEYLAQSLEKYTGDKASAEQVRKYTA